MQTKGSLYNPYSRIAAELVRMKEYRAARAVLEAGKKKAMERSDTEIAKAFQEKINNLKGKI